MNKITAAEYAKKNDVTMCTARNHLNKLVTEGKAKRMIRKIVFKDPLKGKVTQSMQVWVLYEDQD